MTDLLAPDQWKTVVKDATPGARPEAGLVKGVRAAIKAIDQEARTIDFVISDPSVDREGDTIAVAGWDLEPYKANPIVGWAHDYDRPPVGKALTVAIDGEQLRSRAEFVPREISAFAEMVFQMLVNSYLNAVSVGFMPTKWAWVDDDERRYGIDFLEQELLEYSVVPVPANPNALIDARGKGIDTAPLISWAEQALDSAGMDVIKRVDLEALRKAADAKQRIVTGPTKTSPTSREKRLELELRLAKLKAAQR